MKVSLDQKIFIVLQFSLHLIPAKLSTDLANSKSEQTSGNLAAVTTGPTTTTQAPISPNITKLLITNGNDSTTSWIVEVVDLNSTTSICFGLPDYPLAVSGSFGGLQSNFVPLICGGGYSNKCHQYSNKQWKETFPMNVNRSFFAGMAGSPYRNASHKFYVLGNNTSEVLTDSGWQLIGPPLPKTLSFSCLMVINETSILVVAETVLNGKQYWQETFVFNSERETWSAGPVRKFATKVDGCGLVPTSNQSKVSFIVAGSFNGIPYFEVLNDTNGIWQLGK